MPRWKSRRSRALRSTKLESYVIRNLDGAGCGRICGDAARTLCRSHEVRNALELRTHLANVRARWNDRTSLAIDDRDRAALGRSVFPHVNFSPFAHRRLWLVVGNWFGTGRLGLDSFWDWFCCGVHLGLRG